MPMKDGSLKPLVEHNPGLDFSETVLLQMLSALKCLSRHKLIHRDVKPENILYEMDPAGHHHFRLGDFGLSHDPTLARTVAGTEPFMAPEVFNRGTQTEKVDIWSLFATIVWVRNTDNFRHECNQRRYEDIHSLLFRLSREPEYVNIRAMGSYNARDRPSAEAIYNQIYKKVPIFRDPADDLADLLQSRQLIPNDDFGTSAEPGARMPEANNYEYQNRQAEDRLAAGLSPYYEPYPPRHPDYQQHYNMEDDVSRAT